MHAHKIPVGGGWLESDSWKRRLSFLITLDVEKCINEYNMLKQMFNDEKKHCIV